MGEEIPLTLEEPGKKGGVGKSWVVVAFVVGAVIGVVIGYYVNIGTINYVYNLLQSAQAPPPDYAVIFFSPKQMVVATALGTPVRGSEIFLPGGGYDVFHISTSTCELDGIMHVYAVDRARNAIVAMDPSLKVYSVAFPEGEIVGAAAVDAHTVAVATKDPNALVVYAFDPESKDFMEVGRVDLDGAPTAMAFIDEPYPEIMVALSGGRIVSINPTTLSVTRSINVGGDVSAMFLGVKYFFTGIGTTVTSYHRDSASVIASVDVGGAVKQILACRGMLFVLRDNGLTVLRIPTLEKIREFDFEALKMRAGPLCTAVYLLRNSEVVYIAVPSLRTVEKTLPAPADDLVYVSGGTVIVAETRKVTLACGG